MNSIKTPLRRWFRAILLDTAIGSLFIWATYFNHTWLEQTLVVVLSFFTVTACIMHSAHAFVHCIAKIPSTDKEIDRQVIEIATRFWSPTALRIFASSTAFLCYHIITNIFYVCLFINTGHYFLAAFEMYSTFLTVYIIREAIKIVNFNLNHFNTSTREM